MVDCETAKKIAQTLLDASTVEEMALRFAALGLNFPEDPYSRCRILDGYMLHKRTRRNRVVYDELAKEIRRRNSDPDFPMWRPEREIMEKIAVYASMSVDLTDRQADQLFYEITHPRPPFANWRRMALVRYWRKMRRSGAWQA